MNASAVMWPEPLRVLLVDDSGMVRRNLRAYLTELDSFLIVGEAADGQSALDRLAELDANGHLPAVVLMDLVMPGMDGVAATGEIRRRHPEVNVIALTNVIDERLVPHALRAGARGYLMKDALPDAVAAAVRAAGSAIHAQAASPSDQRPNS